MFPMIFFFFTYVYYSHKIPKISFIVATFPPTLTLNFPNYNSTKLDMEMGGIPI